MKNKKIIIIIGILLLLSILVISIILLLPKKKKNNNNSKPTSYEENNFNLNIIKTVNSTQKDNYLISPYSIEIALNMLNEGANNNTKDEIEKVISIRKINDVSIKNKIEIANALFIKNDYKNSISKSFENTIRKNYQGEVLYDKFTSPKVINDWVNNKTHKMIEKVVDEISPDFVLGIANALAIEVEWLSPFECQNTNKASFITDNNKELKVEMMNQTFEGGTSYFETSNSKGIIIPYLGYDKNGKEDYEKGKQLEFIGILPNKNINDFVESLTEEELEEIDSKKELADEKLNINLYLPRFSYDFELENFSEILKVMGIKEVFNMNKADLTNMMTREEMQKNNIDNLYVSTAVHKTHIELNEMGTKAAAVTFFGIDKNSAIMQEPKKVTIKFNKPFLYIIRDKETKEMLFFGVVKKPNIWEKTTCKEK